MEEHTHTHTMDTQSPQTKNDVDTQIKADMPSRPQRVNPIDYLTLFSKVMLQFWQLRRKLK